MVAHLLLSKPHNFWWCGWMMSETYRQSYKVQNVFAAHIQLCLSLKMYEISCFKPLTFSSHQVNFPLMFWLLLFYLLKHYIKCISVHCVICHAIKSAVPALFPSMSFHKPWQRHWEFYFLTLWSIKNFKTQLWYMDRHCLASISFLTSSKSAMISLSSLRHSKPSLLISHSV